jgi:hypothetical protein
MSTPRLEQAPPPNTSSALSIATDGGATKDLVTTPTCLRLTID